ncbi:FKBP-type peptidyl-prolyl cis-trans isomerase [Salinimicrobium sp. HB62]|uniref:FKBP-type peptidyl-prolyl cis-trans isomerase n=1 Tax=Salinimicrobium sp. HB62 TaxID=3077781 RepID=UPI002D7777A9|nr:hypothetical protein [Salinimicrobium sp. HB62]
MKLNKFLLLYLFLAAFAISCDKDDDDPEVVPPRDRGEQEIADQAALEEYLKTHFYNYEEFENPPAGFDYRIQIDTINEANADKIPLSSSPLLMPKTFTYEDVEYTLYVLKVREGAAEQPQPKFSDSTYVAYEGELLNRTTFDSSESPVWFDLTRTIAGFGQGLTEFRGASGFEILSDNTVQWNDDYGIGAIFMPSGLGYFSSFQQGIPTYSPLVFTFHLYAVNEADHDQDGVPSWREDLNGNQRLLDDNTDGDNSPNYLDRDDDGDFIPTWEEISDEDGNIIFPYPDADNDGTPDYLDINN